MFDPVPQVAGALVATAFMLLPIVSLVFAVAASLMLLKAAEPLSRFQKRRECRQPELPHDAATPTFPSAPRLDGRGPSEHDRGQGSRNCWPAISP